MGAVFSSQPAVQQEPSNPPLEETAPTRADFDGEGHAEPEELREWLCLFRKGGGCKENFAAWEKCIEEGEKSTEDLVYKCSSVGNALLKCMVAQTYYYGQVLGDEKKAEAEAIKELEKEHEKQSEESKAETETAAEAQAAKLGNVKAETVAEADAAKELEGEKESKSEESEPVLGKEGNSCDSE